MADETEVVNLDVNDEPVAQGVNRANANLTAYQKKAEAAAKAAGQAFEAQGGVVIRTSDKSRGSIERLTAAWEKQAQTLGKSGVERIIAQRDQLIQRLGNEAAAIDRVRKAAEQMIETEKRVGDSGGGSGFNKTFAIKGVKDVFEGRGTYAIAELVNELMSMKGATLVIAGVATGITAIGFAAYEATKRAKELAEAPAKVAEKFLRLTDETRLTNAELQVTNDKLQNTIAKLEHRPQNNVKLAIDEASEAALKLAGRLDKALQSFLKLTTENAPSWIDRVFGKVGGTQDISKMIGGESGLGGLIGGVYQVSRAGGDPTGKLLEYRSRAGIMLNDATNENASYLRKSGVNLGLLGSEYARTFTPVPGARDQARNIEILKSLIAEIDEQKTSFGLERSNTELSARAGQLEGTSQANDRVSELAKRAQEAFAKAFFDAATPMGKLEGDLYKNALEKQDFLRLNPTASRSGVTSSYRTMDNAAVREFLDTLNKNTAKQDEEMESLVAPLEEGSNKMVHAVFQKKFKDLEKELLSHGLIDQHGAMNSEVVGDLSAPVPKGYFSAQQQLQFVRQSSARFAGTYGPSATMAGVRPERQAEGIYSARLQFADQEYTAEKRRVDLIADSNERQRQDEQILSNLTEKRYEAAMDRERTLLEITKKHFDEIKSTSAGLYQTLFTHPSQFGGQLGTTVRDAALRPVVDRLSTATAQMLTPMFFGGQGADPAIRLAGAGDHLHSAAAALIGAAQSLASGGTGSFGGGGGYFGGSSSTSLYDLPMAGTSAGMAGGSVMNPLGGLAGIVGGPGGTSGFAGPVGGFGGIFGGGGGGGWSGALKNLKGIQLGGLMRSIPRYSMDVDGNLTMLKPSKITGMNGLLGSGVMAGGTMLAQHGLLGSDRGTVGGMVEGAVGGAAIGMVLGGPIGAGIGAAVGFGIGLGEKLANVEASPHEAHRLIQEIYGVNIPEKSGAMQQILGLAQQTGSVSVAVRMPQARQLIEMYAMAGGGRTSLFLDTPHSASLVQQGGTLFQGLSYFNGSGYSYASSLPTLGNSAGTIPTNNPYAGGSGGISLSLDGPATTALLSGQVTRVATPDYVAAQNVAALRSGASRYATAGAILAPNSIFS